MANETARTVFFPDTNVFIQCGPLKALDWAHVCEASVIELFITRPVQSEIDRQKAKGVGRLGKRARAASSLFRKALAAPEERLQIRASAPAVFIKLHQDLRPDPTLSDTLDYQERDDQLVGIAAAYKRAHPTVSATLLTHDTGPMLSAKSVALDYVAVPDSWLLPPETDEQDKAVAALRTELDRYRRAEPAFEMTVDGESANVPHILGYYVALTDAEVHELMEWIRRTHPPSEDFGPTEPARRVGSTVPMLAAITQEEFVPAQQEDIERYRNEDYPNWLSSCESQLRDLHDALNRRIAWPTIKVALANVGSRPAENAYVSFTTQGRLLLEVPRDDKDAQNGETTFPHPPAAPCGIWKRTRPVLGSAFRFGDFISRPLMPDALSRLASLPQARDPNAFYYKPRRPAYPVPTVGYECVLWRHQVTPEEFTFQVRTDLVAGTVSGAIEVQIHGANVTNPFSQRIPFRLNVDVNSTFDVAHSLISNE